MPRTNVLNDNAALNDEIMRLIQMKGGSADADLLKEMITTTLELVDDGRRRGELKILNNALRDMSLSFRVFAPYLQRRKVSVFGSARTPRDAPSFKMAHDFAKRMTDHDYMVITGAGGGVMLGANEGAGRDQSFGCLINLPFEPQANPVVLDDEKLVTYKYFFTRKLTFVKETDGMALFPGGFGTLDECFEALTLIQTGKSALCPVVFLDVPGGDYWKNFERHVDEQLIPRGLISPHDRNLFLMTEDIDTAVEEIVGFYRNYHSVRYVNEVTVLRHLHPVSDELLDELNADFPDVLQSGKIERSDALPAEANEPDIASLPRLVMNFDRRSFGRVRLLVNRLNAAVPE